VATVGKLTVKLKDVVRVTPPPVADTVIVEVPAAAAPLALSVIVEEQLGVQLDEEKEAVTPDGNPDAENVTACALPETKVEVIRLDTDEPANTELFPELLNEKSKGWVTVNEALAMPLGLYPVMKALALTTALPVSIIAPL
jgi:hypothetical protein